MYSCQQIESKLNMIASTSKETLMIHVSMTKRISPYSQLDERYLGTDHCKYIEILVRNWMK